MKPPKVWWELQALAWNRADLRERLARVDAEWRGVLRDAFGRALDEYGLDRAAFPVDAVVALVMTFNLGILSERLVGISSGHDELLAWIDAWLVAQEAQRG